ncbi:MAG: flagellar export protein FliJ [Gammaproteobacteria bacterium]|nr:flagellar export protein FliJ [Gammaproteobacteria bacterium]
MKQSRSKRMQPVADHAGQREQKAVSAFVEALDSLKTIEDQLQQLLGYREEYKQQLSSQQQNTMSMRRVRDYQQFIDNLSSTIENAYRELEEKQRICEEKKKIWIATRSRSQALNSIIAKYQLQEIAFRELLEQKEQDDYAQRIVRNKK